MAMAARLELIAADHMQKHGDYGPMAHYVGTTKQTKAGPVWTGQVNRAPDQIFLKPLAWKRPRMIFVNSMSDLFHPAVPDHIVDRVFAVMAICPTHTFQLLTKRADRQREYLNDPETPKRIAAIIREDFPDRRWAWHWPLINVWVGTSVEDQPRAEERLVDLARTPAMIRWVSGEPLLGPVDFRAVRHGDFMFDALGGSFYRGKIASEAELPQPLGRIHWIVTGGESGPKARPINDQWVRKIRDDCEDTRTAFHHKQWGNWLPAGQIDFSAAKIPTDRSQLFLRDDGDFHACHVGKHKSGRLLDGEIHDGYPAVLA